MKIITKTQYTLLALLTGLLALNAAMAMQPLSDDEMGAVSGQALLMMDMREGEGVSKGLNFYRAGLDAVVELNANFEKLQLGCGGVNGPGCDIDIDHLSLSGQLNPDGTCANGGGPRAACDAILTRPFFEFAIKNDDTPHREIVGFRLSAESTVGTLTFGDQTSEMSEEDSLNGINSLSGYMSLGSATGIATTESRPMSYDDVVYNGKQYQGLGEKITGSLWLTVILVINDVVDISSDTYNLTLSEAIAEVITDPVVVHGNRMTEVNLQGSATIAPVHFSGPMTAYVQNLLGLGINLNLNKQVTGSMTGLTADVPVLQNLAYIHKIDVKENPFSLSMQAEELLWPGAAATALTGWWMAFEDEIDIGSITPANKVELTNEVLLQALNGPSGNAGTGTTCTSPSVNCALYRGVGARNNKPYGIRCDGLRACLGGSLPIGNVNVPKEVVFPLENLKLGAQNVVPNCYGSARFC